ncbi:MAG: hypothetical protein ACMUEL_02625 [Flavobacteriales bacterium Tduv]
MNYIWNVLPEGVSFQKVKHLDPLGKNGERNKKNISKKPGNKRPICLQWNIVVHAQPLMEAITHNLYRLPGLIMRCS